jgi:hypothetical protein
MNPSEYLRAMHAQDEAEATARRKAAQEKGLAAARAARKEKAKRRAAADAVAVHHLAPQQATYGYVQLHTACRQTAALKRCYASVSVAQFIALPAANRCETCLREWAAFKLYVGRTMTVRRLHAFQRQEHDMAELIDSVAKVNGPNAGGATGREAALVRALEALRDGAGEIKYGSPSTAADYLIQLIGHEQAKRAGTATDAEKERMKAVGRALNVELVRMGLPDDVLKALRG